MHSLTRMQTYLPINVNLYNKRSLFKIKNMEIPLNHNQAFCRRKMISFGLNEVSCFCCCLRSGVAHFY